MATIGRETLELREVARRAYAIGEEVDRTDILRKLKKRRKYRRLYVKLRTMRGLALTVKQPQ